MRISDWSSDVCSSDLTRLEPDLDDLLWSTVNLFHRATDRIERELDDNEQAQSRGQREQDGSEVKAVELERLTAEGQTLIERRHAFELMRDQDRKSVGAGKSGSVRVDLGGRRNLKKKKKQTR